MRQRLLEWFYLFTRHRAWWILILVTLIALLSLLFIRDLKLDSDYKDLLPPRDPLIQRFNERQAALQGADEITVLLALRQSPSSQAAGVQQLVGEAERLMEALKGQPEVTSASDRSEIPHPQALAFNLQALNETNLRDLQSNIQALNQASGTTQTAGNKATTTGSGKRLDEIYAQFNVGLQQVITTGGLAVLDPSKLQATIQALTQRLEELSTLNGQVLQQLDQLPSQVTLANIQIDPLLRLVSQFHAQLQLAPTPTADSDLLLSNDQHALLINIHFRQASTFSADYNSKITQMVRRTIRELGFDEQSFHVGLTGSYVYAAESQAAILRDTDKTTIITIIGVSLLFVLILGRLFYPILASLPIFMGLLITLAFVKLTVGSLNLLTTFLPPFVLGMGIDYGIQFITHFLQERRDGRSLTQALHRTMLQKGNAMLIASLATSATLFGLLLSSSPGLQQMGLILGVGVLLANTLTLLVLPSLIVAAHLVLRRHFRGLPPRYALNLQPAIHALVRARWAVIALILGASAYVGITSASQVGFEFVSEKLTPRNLPTVQTRNEIDRAFPQNTTDTQNYFLFFVKNDIDQIQSVSQRLQTVPAIDFVRNYYTVMPPPGQVEDIKEKISQVRALNIEPALAAIRNQFQGLQANLTHRTELRTQLAALRQNLVTAQEQANLNGQETLAQEFGQQQEQAQHLIEHLDQLDSATLTSQVAALNAQLDQLASDAQAILSAIPTPQEIDERLHDPQLQSQLQRYFFTSDGNSIIYAHVQPSWINNSNLYDQFIGQISDVCPSDCDFLGAPMLQARLQDYMERDFKRSTALAIVIILIIIWLDFRKTTLRGATLFALSPLVLGYVWMLATMHWLGIDFNAVTILISPLLLGLGVDNCVYLLHRHQDLGQRDVERATGSTAVPIIANALAAMIGLGSLSFAEMTALQVLGEVALLGIGFTTLFSLTFLPAVLSLMAKRD
jgi:predicted RND superfamily exporter protein